MVEVTTAVNSCDSVQRKRYHSSRQYLEPYRPQHLGLDLDALFAKMESCFAEVLASTDEFPKIDLDPERIPELHLRS